MKNIIMCCFAFFSFTVFSQPVGYYNGVEGLKGEALKTKLNEIIFGQYFYSKTTGSSPSNVWFNNKNDSYYNAKNVFLESDADPNKPGYIIDIYRGLSYDGTKDYGSSAGQLNREHIWAKSHGAFPENSSMYCDYHNLRPSEAAINRKKSNLDFDWTQNGTQFETSGCYFDQDSWEPRNAVKGDVARTIFYMATRYEGAPSEMDLEVVNSVNTYPQPKHGKLSALYEWNSLDLPDYFEINRNEIIYKFQGNRNPYIDRPGWIEMIWGEKEPPVLIIDDMEQSPMIATSSNPVEISAAIRNGSAGLKATLLWGYAFDDLENSVEMELESGRWIAQIPSQSSGKRIYLRIIAQNSDVVVESVNYSYMVYETMPISKVQGEGDHSPYEEETVSVTGIITAAYSNGYYIQEAANPRSAIYIYDPTSRKTMIGNVVKTTGTISDYYGLTELKDITNYTLLQIRVPLPSPIYITASQVSKKYQSMFVKLVGVTCVSMPDNNGNWQVSDASGNIIIHNNNTYSFQPIKNEKYDIQGVLSYASGQWIVELRKEGDVKGKNNLRENEFSEAITVYPNPTHHEVVLKSGKQLPAKNGTLYLYATDGKLHDKKEIFLPELVNGYTIKFNGLYPGYWIVTLKFDEYSINKVVIVK